MTIWVRALMLLVCGTAIALVFRFGVSAVAALGIILAVVLFERHIYKSKLVKNPLGEDRDYSLRPAAEAGIKAATLFVAMALWAALGGLASRYNLVPDTWLGAAIVFVPGLVLLGLSLRHVFAAMDHLTVGGKRK
jgi:hypothetical protein